MTLHSHKLVIEEVNLQYIHIQYKYKYSSFSVHYQSYPNIFEVKGAHFNKLYLVLSYV
jgi:hypothetical protein